MIDSLRGLVTKAGAVCVLALAGLVAGPAAHAEAIGGGEAWFSGTWKLDNDFTLGSSGWLDVRVTDLGVPLTMADRLDSLTFYIGDEFGRVLNSLDRSGVLETWIAQPGTYTLYIFASASTQRGLLNWEADFTPSVVPLPPAIWLMLGGVAWAMGLQRKRAKLASEAGVPAWTSGPALAH